MLVRANMLLNNNLINFCLLEKDIKRKKGFTMQIKK